MTRTRGGEGVLSIVRSRCGIDLYRSVLLGKWQIEVICIVCVTATSSLVSRILNSSQLLVLLCDDVIFVERICARSDKKG